jgi:type I restriction-modification system DNA methylase subunit
LKDPKKIEKVQHTEEFKNLQEDKNFQDFLSDPVVVDQIERKDFTNLLNNPKFKSLLSDKDLIQKMMAVNQKIIEEKNAEIKGALNGSAK